MTHLANKDHLNIVLVTEAYWDVMNGVVMMVTLLARELAARGHAVSIIVPSVQPRRQTTIDGALVCSVPALPLPGGTGYLLALPWLSRGAVQIMRDADVIHTHHPFFMGRWAQQHEKPVVFTSHTNYLAYLHYVPAVGPWLGRPLARYLRHFCNRCAAVIAPAKDAATRLSTYGVDRLPTVIPNGIQTERFKRGNRMVWRSKLQLPSSVRLLLYVGRLAKEKRIEIILQSLRELPEHFRLLVVGGGPMEMDLKAFVQAAALGTRVHFAGQQDVAQLPDIYAAADIFVTASDSEVHPLVLLEAHAAGLPAVVVDAPGTAEIVRHGWTGLITENSLGGFRSGLLTLAADPGLIHQMGMNAQQYAQQFSLAASVDALVELYRNQ